MSKRLRLSLRGPAGAVAISRDHCGFSVNFGEFETFYVRFPRRFAPCNDKTGTFDKPGTVWESQTVKKSPLCRIMPTSYRNNLLQGKRVYAIMQKNVGTISASCRLILQRGRTALRGRYHAGAGRISGARSSCLRCPAPLRPHSVSRRGDCLARTGVDLYRKQRNRENDAVHALEAVFRQRNKNSERR